MVWRADPNRSCKGQWRYYMDPTMSVLISLMIFAIGTPLSRSNICYDSAFGRFRL
jgi:hypothetical protein